MAEVRWTLEEGWLMAELARRWLVSDGALEVEVRVTEAAIVLGIRLRGKTATLALVPGPHGGHRWRDSWVIEVVRGDEVWRLEPGAAPIEIDRAGDEELVGRLFVRGRQLTRVLDGVPLAIPLFDPCFHRYTKQSSAASVALGLGELAPWMSPTEPEQAPWWELDFGAARWVGWIRVDLVRPPAGTIVVCEAYGFAMPDGTPRNARVFEALAESLEGDDGGAWFAVQLETIARFLRVSLVAAQAPVALAVTASEVCAAELFDADLPSTVRRGFALHAARRMTVDPPVSYEQAWTTAMALARGLALRLEVNGERVTLGVMLRNGLAWILVELAALARGYVVVAMSPDDPDDRLAHIVERSRLDAVICEGPSGIGPAGASCAARLERFALRLVVSADGPELGAIIAEGAATRDVPPARAHDPDELYCVLFTSGSTGMPKGAMRTYRTFHAMQTSYAIAHVPRHLSFQPVSHLSERMYLPAVLVHGGTIAFSRGGAHLLDDLRAFAPTTVGTVPRVFEVLHAAYLRRVRADPDAEPAALAEARGAFGDNVTAVSVGSAPVSAEVLAFMRRCFADIWVSEGYGSTEVGTIAFDGVVLDHVEVRLVPRPDAPPRAPGEPERGEIYVRTPHTISGYLGDDEATRRAIDADGYFATGDLGERGADRRVRVIGRARNTVKLAQGEFVSAERIETALGGAAGVDRIYVHVEHGAPYVSALVVPHADAAVDLLAALRTHGIAAGLAAYELPRDLVVEATPPTVENGLLTPSGKLARGAFHARFGAQLSALAHGRAAVDGAGTLHARFDARPSAAHDRPAIDGAGTLHARSGALAHDHAAGGTLDRVVRIVRGIVRRDVDPHEALGAGVGIDSLASAEILAALADELGRDVPLGWWFEVRDLAELAARIDGRAGASQQLALATEDLAAPPPTAVPAEATRLARILLTGATGLLGAHLAAAFARSGIGVRCLVRGADPARRLAAALDAHRLAAPGAEAIAGDLAGELPEALVEGVDAIVHAGATVSWLASYTALRGPNVGGTRALLELAARRGLPFHFVSTISVAPATGDEVTRLSLAEAAAGTPYGLSKWVAEELVRRAGAAGLPIAVYRPAMIAPATGTGLGNREDYLHRYMHGCLELGMYIDRDDARIDFTPVDHVAAAIAGLVRARHQSTTHIVNIDRSPTFAGLGRAMVAAGAELRAVSYAEFREALLSRRGTAAASRLHALRAFFPEQFVLGMGPWPCPASHAAIAALGLTAPVIDDAYLARVVRAMSH